MSAPPRITLRNQNVRAHDAELMVRTSHNITERQHQIDLLRRVRAWFARWL